GDYTLIYNTFANFNTRFNRQNTQFLLDNSPYKNEQGQIELKCPLNYSLANNIIYGSLEEELLFNSNSEGEQSFTTRSIQNSLFRTKITGLNINNNIISQEPLFPLFENVPERKYKVKA